MWGGYKSPSQRSGDGRRVNLREDNDLPLGMTLGVFATRQAQPLPLSSGLWIALKFEVASRSSNFIY